MTKPTVSDHLLDRLKAWNVERIFGFPGDGVNGILGALERAPDRFEFVQTRHEEMAAFMACGHAKFTGEVGVCLATSGPGAIHLLNGLYDAKLDHQPVVAIVGQQARAALGGHYQQEVDLTSLFKDVASDYVHVCMTPAQLRHLVDRAFRIAKSERTVTCIILPDDVQMLEAVETPPREHGTVHSSAAFTPARIVPGEDDLRQAAEILNAGERVAILAGAGALEAGEELEDVAELLGAGVAKALLGKAVLPDDLPFVTGSIGLLGTKPSWKLMQECDTLLMVGSGFPYAEFLPEEGQAKGIQIDISGKMLSIRYPMDLALQGEAKATLKGLIPYLNRKDDRSWRDRIERWNKDWWEDEEARAMEAADPINPERLFWEASSRLPENAMIAVDTGTSTNWYARAIRLRRGMKAAASGGLATMGPGVPYAIAAKFAYPERTPVAFVGDGAMQMLGINGLITIAKYWRAWSDPRLVIAVSNNQDLAQVTWEMRALAGNPDLELSQDVPKFPYAEYAEMLGLKGLSVSDPERLGAVWDEAFRADRPVVIDAHVDPDTPTLPPHISLKQARNFASALVKGDPHGAGIAWQSAKRLWDGVTPG